MFVAVTGHLAFTATDEDLRERIKVRDTPSVNNFRTERDLVTALQVTVAVCVTVTNDLKRHRLLKTPANRGEVTHARANTRCTLLDAKVRHGSAGCCTVILKR